MGLTSLDPTDLSGDVKIGAPSHLVRNLAVVLALGAAAAGVYGFSSYEDQRENARLSRFDAFRAAYADKCNVPSYAGPVTEVVRDDYLTSPPMQVEIDRQLAALNGGAACEAVALALKKVDLAVPPAGPAE
jgi:hypothetical protein